MYLCSATRGRRGPTFGFCVHDRCDLAVASRLRSLTYDEWCPTTLEDLMMIEMTAIEHYTCYKTHGVLTELENIMSDTIVLAT